MLKHFIDCISLPLLLCVVLSIKLPVTKIKIKLICITIVLLSMNLFLENRYTFSSRYYSLFILVFIYFYSSSFKKNLLCLFLFIILVAIQITDVFMSDRNSYIYDLREIAKRLQLSKQATVLIQKKEYLRLSHKLDRNILLESFFNDTATLNEEIKKYTYYDTPVYFLGGLGSKELMSFSNNNYKTELTVRISSQNKKKTFFLLSYSNTDDLKNTTNLLSQNEKILNGNIEDVIPANQNENIKKWIYQGATFYDNPAIFLPKCSSLLPTWLKISDSYPQIYADSKKPIEGNFSLHLILKNSEYPVFLLNGFKSKPGVLSFKIQSAGRKTSFSIKKYDYDQSYKLIDIYPTYRINVSDSDIHQISIEYKQSDFKGRNSVFAISGNESDILIDNISFCVW